MELLEAVADKGYPLPYLAARLKARRETLVRDWEARASSGEVSLPVGHPLGDDPDAGLLRQHRWVYSQMNGRLRKAFWTYFFAHELATVHACVRYRARPGKEDRVKRALAESLLSRPMKKILMEAESLPVVLDDLEGALRDSFAPEGLREAFREGGVRAVEERVADAFYPFALGAAGRGLLKPYFAYLIDARNILHAHKRMRWPEAGKFSFIKGGSISGEKMALALERLDSDALRRLALRAAGLDEAGAPADISVVLMRGLLKRFARGARTAFDEGFVLAYLVERHAEAVNARTVLRAAGFEPGQLAEELVV
ncbi:MAG: hypothetical protein Kow0025_11600 [Thermodesulfovibrionales bacterium]